MILVSPLLPTRRLRLTVAVGLLITAACAAICAAAYHERDAAIARLEMKHE